MPTFSIGELAASVGLPVSTIRYCKASRGLAASHGFSLHTMDRGLLAHHKLLEHGQAIGVGTQADR